MFLLASRSPQRRAILERLGVPFEVVPSPFEEESVMQKDPEKRALMLACGKAEPIARKYPDRFVIGCDTLVVASSGELLEKPRDAEDARRMLQLHSDNISIVHSALCIQRGTEKHTGISSVTVHFRKLSEKDVDWWIGTELWRDRSGGFQIEGEGERLFEKIEGERETVVGFPVRLFQELCEMAEIR